MSKLGKNNNYYCPDGDPNGISRDHCSCWYDCKRCCYCGNEPICERNDKGFCVDCGARLDREGKARLNREGKKVYK